MSGAGRTGPPKTPREVKRRRGTLRNDRDGGTKMTVLPAIEPVEKAPPAAPDRHGLDFVQEILDSGGAIWIGQTDIAALEVLRQVWDDREKARLLWLAQLLEAHPGHIPFHDEKLFNAYDKLTLRVIQALGALGFDPTARARLGVAEVKRKTTLERLQDKRANRKAGRPAS